MPKRLIYHDDEVSANWIHDMANERKRREIAKKARKAERRRREIAKKRAGKGL